MCHHTLGTESAAWRHERDDEEAEADEAPEAPSFTNEEADVDVALLDADNRPASPSGPSDATWF